MGYNSIDGKKRCPKCGFAINKLSTSIYCCPEKRYKKYILAGIYNYWTCGDTGSHTHFVCSRCNHEWIYLPTDTKWNEWQRNVVDKYKTWSNEDIKNDLIKNALPCAVLCAHVDGDFNISNIIRTCNSFGIVNFYYYGKKHIDRRGAVGCQNYLNISHLSSIKEVLKLKEKYSFVGIENNIEKTIPLNKFDWKMPKPALMIFGEENSGIDESLLKHMDYLVEINSTGSIRSLNVATAAGIVIYSYCINFDKKLNY